MNLRDLDITPDLLKFIAEIDEFKGSWRLLKTLSPERLRSLRHVATIESIGSSGFVAQSGMKSDFPLPLMDLSGSVANFVGV
jgi:hypothetical protein